MSLKVPPFGKRPLYSLAKRLSIRGLIYNIHFMMQAKRWLCSSVG